MLSPRAVDPAIGSPLSSSHWHRVKCPVISDILNVPNDVARKTAQRCHDGNLKYPVRDACQYVMQLPSPRLIQELVQAWKALRRRG